MERSKLLNDLTDDELLELANAPTSPSSVVRNRDLFNEYNHDVLNFLLAFNLKPGKEKVAVRILYDLYKAWSKIPVTQKSFSQQLALFIPKQATVVKSSSVLLNDCWKINKSNKLLRSTMYKLLQKVPSYDRRKLPKWQQHLKAYLKYQGLEKGDHWLEAYVIYHMYDKWCYMKRKKSQLGYHTFYAMLKDIFEHRKVSLKESGRHSNVVKFKVNDAIWKALGSEGIENVRKAKRKTISEKQKQKISQSLRGAGRKSESENS